MPGQSKTLGVQFIASDGRVIAGPINETQDGLTKDAEDVTDNAVQAVPEYVIKQFDGTLQGRLLRRNHLPDPGRQDRPARPHDRHAVRTPPGRRDRRPLTDLGYAIQPAQSKLVRPQLVTKARRLPPASTV